MKTITVVAYNRPRYLFLCLEAIAQLKKVGDIFDKLIISIEPGCETTIDMAMAMAQVIAESGVIDVEVVVNETRLGVAGHPLALLTRVFEVVGSDFNMQIEDDAVLKPDAAILAEWFYYNFGSIDSNYALMSMCNHTLNKEGAPPHVVLEAPHITSPFAWCTTKYQWPQIKAFWNFKQYKPLGWDWSLSMGLFIRGQLTLHPALSRCQNIGREGGVHETEQTFDMTQLGITYADDTSSDGSYTLQLDAGLKPKQLDWMNLEFGGLLGKR